MSTSPTLVFVPGAWHQAKCYDRIIEPLRNEHHLKCVPVTLPSTTGDAKATLKNDIDAVRAAISAETTAGHDVVVIVHSYGGVVGESAVKGFTQSSVPNDVSNSTGYVKALVCIATGFTITGLSFLDPFFGMAPPFARINRATGFMELATSPRELFYHDLSANDAAYWISQLTPQSLKALAEGGEHTYTGWKDVPVWFVGTMEDRGIPVMAQRLNVGMARGQGAVVHYSELSSSHSPFLSMPGEVVEIIMQAVDAVSGKGSAREVAERKGVAAPAVRLGAPGTWFRFGLPFAVGRGLGWAIFGFIGLTRRVKWM